MKKHKKIKKNLLVFFIILIAIIITPFILSKYTSIFHDYIVLNVRYPNYTVVFNANGGTGEMENQDFTYGTPQNLTANSFTKTNYIFSEWNTESDGSGTTYTDEENVDKLTEVDGATVNLYAIWVEEQKVTVTFDSNGGTVPTFESKEVYVEKNYGELPTTTRDNYTFLGWSNLPAEYQAVEYIESTGTQYIKTDIVPKDSMDLYLKLSSSDITTDFVYAGSAYYSSDSYSGRF